MRFLEGSGVLVHCSLQGSGMKAPAVPALPS